MILTSLQLVALALLGLMLVLLAFFVALHFYVRSQQKSERCASFRCRLTRNTSLALLFALPVCIVAGLLFPAALGKRSLVLYLAGACLCFMPASEPLGDSPPPRLHRCRAIQQRLLQGMIVTGAMLLGLLSAA